MLLIRKISSESMQPTFHVGNIIFAWRFLRPRIGDVVIARLHHQEVLRRIADMRQDRLYVTGDNPDTLQEHPAGWLTHADILGVVASARRMT